MERSITITLEKAREWYNSDNESLKEIALQAFSKEELDTFGFTNIKTFEDALTALEYNESTKVYIRNTINDISMYSKASAAMSKLNIIRKALNLGQDLHLTKSPDKTSFIWYPQNPFITKDSICYRDKIESNKMEVVGKFKSNGEVYRVLSGTPCFCGEGLGLFNQSNGLGDGYASSGFLGCATKEIAQHFGKYFGMLITEAKYADMVDFEIIENKYQ